MAFNSTTLSFALTPQMIADYQGGIGLKALAKKYRVGHNTIKRRLLGAGAHIAGRTAPKGLGAGRGIGLQPEAWSSYIDMRDERRFARRYESIYYKQDISRKYRSAKKERDRYHTRPQHMLRVRLRRRLRKMIEEKKAYRRTQELLGCDYDFLRAYIESKFNGHMSWTNHGKWELDHIIPLAKFDLNDESQLRKAFHFSNLHPKWMAHNRRKRDLLTLPVQPQLLISH